MAIEGLLFKEWKMMKGFFIGQFVVTVILLSFSSLNPIHLAIDQLVEMLILSVIIIPAALLFSLNTEVNQLQSFLHNPHSVHKLLLAKLLYGLFAAFALLVVLTFILTIYVIFSDDAPSLWKFLVSIGSTTVNMLVLSLYPAAVLLFFWTLHQIFRTRVGGGISIVLVIALLIASSKGLSLFEESAAYKLATHWGKVFGTSGFQFGPAYIGVYLFFALITLLIYFASVYLIERKVEA